MADKLEQLGYLVRKQIGSQGFYIDLAVVDPENPGRYIIGIECDGRAYHSARSARDRDRLRQLVLENIGWRIHRIWSTDWFRNPEQELKRVVESIEKAKEIMLVDDDSSQDEIVTPEIELVREEIDGNKIVAPQYEYAILPKEIAYQEFHLHPIGKIARWIAEVVKKEGPVHIDEVARRICETGGIARIGNRIKDALNYATQAAIRSGSIKKKDDFLWDIEMKTPVVRDRSNLPSNARKVTYIAPEEILIALEMIVQDSIAIRPLDAVPFVVRAFGFTRITEEMKQYVVSIVMDGIKNKVVSFDGDLLKPSLKIS